MPTFGVILVALLWAQVPDPARGPLEKAYDALRARRYETAIVWFRRALEMAPAYVPARKDLAYTYLKIGEAEAARDQFALAMRADPSDWHVALEYAFLCHQTRQRAEARRVFDRVRRAGDPASRATAEQAFQNIDRPLAEGIRRWSEAAAASPDNFSAHQELARLAEERDELELAARHYLKAWHLRPADQSLLLDLGRVWNALGKADLAASALVQAASGPEPRVAEAARELLPPDLAGSLENLRAAGGPAPEMPAARPAAKEMAERSYRLGYLKDALRYWKMANEEDPADFSVMLKLGWTYNALRQDGTAVRWFDLARKSPDPAIAAEAARASRGLRSGVARFRTTAWAFPFYSSRWSDLFSYGQVKTEMRIGRLPFRPYLSVRFAGDTRRTTSEALPQYLSESSFLLGVGLAGQPWHGITLWGEAATALSYLGRDSGNSRARPDYRGGAAYAKSFGQVLGGEASGLFFETNDDGVFLSRFQRDVLLYSQNRVGYTPGALGPLRTQMYWNTNFTTDIKRQYWANFVETGPGVRFRWNGLPPALTFSVNVLRGAYLLNQGNPRGPNFFDVRAGFWYAVTR